MHHINTNQIECWHTAHKTRPIRAKHLSSIIVDNSIISKLLLETLEGRERLGNDVVICVGEYNDVWQQTPAKLLQKYNVTDIDCDV